MKNINFNIINILAIEHAKYLLRDYGEIKNIHTIEQKKEFFKKSYYRNSLSIQQKLTIKNPGAGFYIGETLVKNSKNNQYWQINIVDDQQNFINSIPLWCMQIVLFELKDKENADLKDNVKIVYSYFYMPNTDDLWTFELDSDLKKQGLFNYTKIHQLVEKEVSQKRIYGSDILTALFVSVNKTYKTEFEIKDVFTKELIMFIFDISKVHYRVEEDTIRLI